VTAVTVRVPAKVNLQLSVGPLRDDGYHDLVNVFHAVSLADEVTAVPADRLQLSVEAAPRSRVDTAGVPLDHGNLAVRAALLVAARLGVEPQAALRIRKAIPVAGGMAGGSADAAAALIACARLWDDREDPLLGRAGLLELAAAVYAECDRLRAARGERPRPPRVSQELMTALATGDAKGLGGALANDLQPAALLLKPALRRTLAAGRDLGALGSLVSGSGPTCAFLAESDEHATEIADGLDAAGVTRAVVRAHGPVPGTTIL
jgi:4-diphosphocytidyl-2-C-methyl-D-erythritol kinase